MKLSERQVQEFRDEGYIFVPDLIPSDQMKVVREELPALLAHEGRERLFEPDGRTVRSILNAHLFDDALDRLARHPRLIEPAMQLAGGPVYIFQTIVNVKRAFDGQQWQWHQDYPTYRIDDKMPAPRGVNAMVFLDEVSEFNGPLMLVPGSQALETEAPAFTADAEYPGRYAAQSWIQDIMRTHGIRAPKGAAGSVIFMHLNIVHGSGPNMSPWHRAILSLTLSSVENKATGTRRGFVVCHDYTAVAPLADDCLLHSERTRAEPAPA